MPWSNSRPKHKTAERGYDKTHQKAREFAASVHKPTDPCARCGHKLGPMGPWLHYDHNDARSGYLGFSHGRYPCLVCGKRCNLRAGAKAGRRVQQVRKRRIVVDRW
jgi:hypothetical protein